MSPIKRHRTRLSDVAQRAGVSSQTVSRVVRGLGVVAPSTRERVLAAVEELGYRPNWAARSLSQRRTNVVHVMNATPLFHGHARTFLAVVDALGELGYQISVGQAVQRDVSRPVVPLGVDGVVVLGGHDRSVDLLEAIPPDVPVVFIGEHNHSVPSSVASVSINQAESVGLATSHLLECGYSNLAHLCGPKDWLDARERRNGFISACVKADVPYHHVAAASWNAMAGYSIMPALPDDVDGIVCANDHLALGAMRWLTERGRAVPNDVGVIGFDDADGAENFIPPLTTIQQPHREMGQTAVAHLAAIIEGGEPQHTVLSPQLIIRKSTQGA